jgi:hypothetical protein
MVIPLSQIRDHRKQRTCRLSESSFLSESSCVFELRNYRKVADITMAHFGHHVRIQPLAKILERRLAELDALVERLGFSAIDYVRIYGLSRFSRTELPNGTMLPAKTCRPA